MTIVNIFPVFKTRTTLKSSAGKFSLSSSLPLSDSLVPSSEVAMPPGREAAEDGECV